eukprot:4832120-Alexandrium_andersonii.AAC.1
MLQGKYMNFKNWAAREVLLGTVKDLAQAKEAWNKELQKPGANVLKVRGTYLLGEFDGVLAQERETNEQANEVEQAKAVNAEEDLQQIMEESHALRQRAFADQRGGLAPSSGTNDAKVDDFRVHSLADTGFDNTFQARTAARTLKRRALDEADQQESMLDALGIGLDEDSASATPKKAKKRNASTEKLK